MTNLRQRTITYKQRVAQSIVEFALVLWPFMMILFAVIDYGEYYFYEHSLRYSLSVAGRYATPGLVFCTNALDANGRTNCPLTGIYSNGKWISRNESIRRTFSNNCALNPPLNMLKICSWPGTNSATETLTNLGPGYASDYVRLTAEYQMHLITPIARLLFSNGVCKIKVQSIFLNEPSANFDAYKDIYSAAEPL